MEAHLVRLGRTVAAALLGPDVDDHRPPEVQRAVERLEERPDVVTRHDPDVRDAEILEQLARLGEVDDRTAEPAAPLEDGWPDERDPLDEVVVGRLALLPGARKLDLGEVVRERPDRRADRHLVVVEHDQELRFALADVVERLEREPAHEGGITDDHRHALEAVAEVAGGCQALGDGQARPRVAAVEDVVLRFAAPREPADAVQLAEGREPLETAGQQLVRIGLMPGVPDDPVARRLEQAVERDRQLHDAQRRAQVAAGLGDGLDDGLPNLGRKAVHLRVGEAPQVGRTAESGKDRQGLEGSSGRGGESSAAPRNETPGSYLIPRQRRFLQAWTYP